MIWSENPTQPLKERESLATTVFGKDKERKMSVLEREWCFKAIRGCFWLWRDIYWPMMRGGGRGGAGEKEGGKERKKRYLVYNSKRVANDICDLFKCADLQNIFSICYFVVFFYCVRKQEKTLVGFVMIIIFLSTSNLRIN